MVKWSQSQNLPLPKANGIQKDQIQVKTGKKCDPIDRGLLGSSIHGILQANMLFSCQVTYDYLRPHELQRTRLPCPSPSPGVCSDSCPLSLWCHSTISSSVVPFFSCPLSFPASGSFPMSRLFISGSQSIGASTSALVLPINIQGWFPLGLTGLILECKPFPSPGDRTRVSYIGRQILYLLYHLSHQGSLQNMLSAII